MTSFTRANSRPFSTIPLFLAVFLTITSLHSAFANENSDRVIYGTDNRKDLYQETDTQLLKLADSTVALFKKSGVTVSDGVAKLSTQSYAKSYSLCASEPFFDQNVGAFCSGSLIGEDLILTAGHCVRSASSCAATSFVFGFNVRSEGKFPTEVAADEVYNCASLVYSTVQDQGADFAIVRLDRKVTQHAPLTLNEKTKISKNTPIAVIGHPAGLPTKIADGATVRDPSPKGFFVANLDTYGGNSGSAVFNTDTGEVEGVLVRGETDYKYDSKKGCYVSNVCSSTGCRGEDVTKIESVLPKVPE